MKKRENRVFTPSRRLDQSQRVEDVRLLGPYEVGPVWARPPREGGGGRDALRGKGAEGAPHGEAKGGVGKGRPTGRRATAEESPRTGRGYTEAGAGGVGVRTAGAGHRRGRGHLPSDPEGPGRPFVDRLLQLTRETVPEVVGKAPGVGLGVAKVRTHVSRKELSAAVETPAA